jgi:hypothetical protein
VRKPRKLKPETRIEYLRRDLRIARSMLEVASSKFLKFSHEVEQAAVADHSPTVIASDMREMSSQCASYAEKLNGW